MELLEVAEILIWLGTACRTSSRPDVVDYCIPKLITDPTTQDISVEYSFSSFDNGHGSSCWRQMFRNPVIAGGYPVAKRETHDQGLEIPLNILLTLSHVTQCVSFEHKMFLRGFSSALGAMSSTTSSITWHFFVHLDGTRILSNQIHDSLPVFDKLDTGVLLTKRHFVGWTQAATVIAGRCDAAVYKTEYG